jgi:hypothetical protein
LNIPGSRLEYETAVPRQSRLGFFLLLIAVLAALACIALLTGAKDDYLRLGAAAGCALLSWILAKAGKRRRIPVLSSSEALIKLAARTEIPVVVYLRRFVDDQQVDHPPAQESSVHDSDEAELAASFASTCLFVAVGRPGEPLPPWGAYRLYLEDDVWEEKVSELISIASVVFVKWADSGPLGTEIELIKRAAKLNRTVFLLPFEESPENLRHFLPGEPLFEIETPDKPTGKQYAAFFTLTERGGQVHYRDRNAGYGEAARKVISDSFGITDLSKSQIKVMRGFYGALENLVSKLMTIALYAFVSAWAGAMSLVAMLLVVTQLPDGATKNALENFFFGDLEFLFTGLGLVLAASLVLLLLLVVIAQRAMP